MRLEKVRRGQGILRLLFPIMGWKIKSRLPDVMRTLMYRPASFGRAYNDWIQAVMRGPSPWSVWERELFASFTSRCNECIY
jgi:hypothetical protein